MKSWTSIRLPNMNLILPIRSGPEFSARVRSRSSHLVHLRIALLLLVIAFGWPILSTSASEVHPSTGSSAACLTTGQAVWPYSLERPGATADSGYLQGKEHQLAGDRQAMIAQLRAAWTRDPGNGDYAQALALAYIESREYALSETVIAGYKRECGNTALAYAMESELHFQQRQFSPAYREAQESLKISATNPRMHELLGLIFVVRGDYLAALPELETAAQQAPGDPQVRYFYGRALYSSGHYPEALSEFLACLKLAPHYVRALENLGLCYEALKEFTKAAEAYQKAIEVRSAELNSKDVEAYSYYGELLAKLGRNAEATAVLHKALAINPRSFRANYELGRLFLDRGDLGQAEHYLLEAATLAPTFSQTYYLIGKIYLKEHRPPDAARYFAVFRELNKIPTNREFPYPRE